MKENGFTLKKKGKKPHSLEQAAGGIGLQINTEKAENICCDKKRAISTLNDSSLKLVDKFTYLGRRVSSAESDINMRRCPWCNSYLRRKWTRRHEFKSWTRLIAFHIALIPLGTVWIQIFSLQLWVNSRIDWFLQPWWGN